MGVGFYMPHQACWMIYSIQVNSNNYRLCYQMDGSKTIFDQHNDNCNKIHL